MITLGLGITAATLAVLAVEFLRRRRYPFPLYGWVGLAALLAAEALLLRGVQPVATYFTPLAWTCYIFLADAAVAALTGRSRLRDHPTHLLGVALLSLPLWLIFEAYNLRLENWTYVGVPRSLAPALLGYGWSFATITPGIFETADLIEGLGWWKRRRPIVFSIAAERLLMAAGAVVLALPLVLPQRVAAYLFALVWVGFVLLLDPINRRLGQPSLLGDLAAGCTSRLWSLVAAGWVCGWLWEFWNFWAAAKWRYIFPMFQEWKIFEMPAPGYLGFLPFALECFVMYVTASWAIARLAGRRAPATSASMKTE